MNASHVQFDIHIRTTRDFVRHDRIDLSGRHIGYRGGDAVEQDPISITRSGHVSITSDADARCGIRPEDAEEGYDFTGRDRAGRP
jgi:hypothetical protein